MFYSSQSNDAKEKYKANLKSVGALSNLFSDSTIPSLYYRAAENLFCLAFNAENLSRSDVSADAKKGNIGIGLKTFLHKNGNNLEKVAEFNSISDQLSTMDDENIVRTIAEARNQRINSTMVLHGLESMIYHCVTRDEGIFNFYEFPMDKIDLDSIRIIRTGPTIKFRDRLNEYSFNKSKSTLFKRFSCTNLIDRIEIEIINNPIETIQQCLSNRAQHRTIEDIHEQTEERNPYIYLPLYAPSYANMEPAERSGLNQWNASGRVRDPNEVYIPVPAWIHQKYPDFFPQNNNITFNLILPNEEILSAKMCQEGQKGLMSNPNRALGRWLLRDVFGLPEWTLVTRNILDIADIDSAYVEKTGDGEYKIDFASVGQYEEFKNINLGD